MNLESIYKELNRPNNTFHKGVLKLINKIESYTNETEDAELKKFYKYLCNDIILLIYDKTKIIS
jgi:hypothetical protein